MGLTMATEKAQATSITRLSRLGISRFKGAIARTRVYGPEDDNYIHEVLEKQ